MDGPTTGCATGLTNCDGKCVDVKTDPLNCGGCGLGCAVPVSGRRRA